ncbi:MAG: bifunctional (p)ppGpp synthetase/guanosine-3',5'-bis(diphosphate) 3'-pyrophosphohydrolase [Candidatus Hydrogenedentes bacterium]|nr:bifunctional (p)ppGpp synthetase/guanosine-3',5'-bis(diphosphate) 3'-pyrophosphohydrolase [Candidatus Hydrogenedentota bacterium]
MKYTRRISDAFAFAHEIHAEHTRKGSGVPYITHVMAVAAIVGEHGGDEDTFIAALLHDAVEDGDGYATLDSIRGQFGTRVADLVEACSDAFVKPKPEWRERKEKFVATMRNADPEVKLIVAADKLHNICATIGDYERIGEELWARFNGGREGTLWYYVAIAEALADGWDHPLADDLTTAVETLHDLCK